MYNHAPENYICPICIAIQGIEDDRTMIRKSDIVFQDELVTVFIGSFFVGNNPGHPIIVPNAHYENLYDLADAQAQRIMIISRTVAQALKKSHACTGITVQQNNEPASNQHAFHYHMHLFPRYANDQLESNMSNSRRSSAEERSPYAKRLRQEISKILS